MNVNPITEDEFAAMEKLQVPRAHIERLLETMSLEEVAQYVRGSLRAGDDSDEAAGPRVEDQ